MTVTTSSVSGTDVPTVPRNKTQPLLLPINLVQFISAMFVVTSMTCLLATSVTAANSGNSASRPNIVLIMVDDMGYGDPGCYNSDSRIPTPNIDSIANLGMRFTDAHASGPLCHMSRYGLMTGRYPFRVDVGAWRKRPLIEEGEVTVPSLLRSCGYRTAMVGKWHLGFQENGYDNPLPGGPTDRGFDTFFGIRASTDIPPYFYIRGRRAVAPPTNRIDANYSDGWSRIQGAFWREGGIAPGFELKDVLPRFTDEAVTVIESHSAQKSDPNPPLFLYVAFPAPHTPWLPAPEYVGRSGAGMYGDFMVMVDDMVGRILKALDAADMSQDTLLVFTSDNGPVWYDTDVARFDHDASGGLRGMKADAWECGHRMPFLVRWPKRVQANSDSGKLISFTDLLATLADVTGSTLSADDGPDSFSFLPELIGNQESSAPQRTDLVLQSGNGFRMIRSESWKLIDGLGSGGFSDPKRVKPNPGGPVGQLYDMIGDTAETQNVYADHPEIVDQLKFRMSTIVEPGRSRP